MLKPFGGSLLFWRRASRPRVAVSTASPKQILDVRPRALEVGIFAIVMTLLVFDAREA